MSFAAHPEAPVALRILGSIEVRNGRDRLVPRRRLARVLLGVLALRPNTSVPLEWIVDTLWNGEAPRSAAANVRSYIAELRRLLRPVDLSAHPGTDLPWIESSGGNYLLAAPLTGLDALRFVHCLTDGRRALASGRPDLAAGPLIHGCALWRGPVLDGTPIAGAVASSAVTLEALRLDAIEECVEARLALGQHAELAAELAGLTTAHGLRERLWQQRMRALWLCGRPAEALSAYRNLAQLLDRELGIMPSRSTRDLYGRIRQGGPESRTDILPTGP